MALWTNYDDIMFHVVVNGRGECSVWPTTRPLPHGWVEIGFTGPRDACLAEIDNRFAVTSPSVPFAAETTPPPPTGAAHLRGPRRAVPDMSIMELIRAQDVSRDRIAAWYGSERVARGELLDTAAAWAAALAEAGCGRDVPVAIRLPRSVDALTAILAVLDAGGAYVPLSCDDSPDRIRSILRDCGAPIVITSDELAPDVRPHDGDVVTLSALRTRRPGFATTPGRARGEDLAYIFYTSGTTGEPKGVEGTHGQLVNYALWCRAAFALRPDETTFLSASLFFLGSLTTIFTPLLEGWPIVIAPDGATTDTLLELSTAARGGLLKLTPTHIRMMMARGVPESGLARQLMVGSEPLTFTSELKEWMSADPGRVVVNHYGLTETHGCFCHWLTGSEEIGGRVPIGLPIDNVDAYIVDRDCEPVDVGETGELLVGGPSIGRGYRGRPAQTAERWIPHPWGVNGARLLRTGDLARLEADGVVTVLGRADRQVKIRGHRVEPSALEEALRQTANVREALVLPRPVGNQMTLDAFLLRTDGADVDLAAVSDDLRARFPPQWQPARMAVLSEFPVNANGKVDISRLPEPAGVARPVPNADRWSRMDRAVASAFCDALDIDDIGLHDDFFALGGDSLAAAELAARLGKVLGRNVPAPTADGATVRAYALVVAAATDASQAR